MSKETITHENLRKVMAELQKDFRNAPEEAYRRLFEEFKYSNLICAGEMKDDEFKFFTCSFIPGMSLAAVFTDMNELRKVFPDFETETHEFPFHSYIEIMKKSNLYGMIVNAESEAFLMPTDAIENMDEILIPSFSCEDSYTSAELKDLKDSLNNENLESFIKNPENIAKYEDLFDLIAKSTLLTLVVSYRDLNDYEENGIIEMEKTGPLGYHYLDKTGGKYSTVFTSEAKIGDVDIRMHKYSEIVNFAQMVCSVLTDDLDGMIINPGSENVVLTRDVLLEFSSLIVMTCNDSKLNSGIRNMFTMEA